MEDCFVKHFTRTASPEEETALYGWLDANEEHLQEYLYRRLQWDVLLLNMPAGEPSVGFAVMYEARMRRKRYANDVMPEANMREPDANLTPNNPEPDNPDLKGLKIKFNSRRIMLQRIGRIAAVFIIAFGSGWMINSLRPTTEPAMAYHTVEVPDGQRVQLTLADGTSVWLNAQTKLIFPEAFDKHSRTVKLEGEGVFDVASDKNRPFTVQTCKYDIMATGTKFDVYAYNNSEAFETVMIEGSVEISLHDTATAQTTATTKSKTNLASLTAGEKLYYDENKQELVRKNVSPTDYTLWIDGIYKFDDIAFSEMSKRLERYYHISIIINDSTLLNYRCNGTFLHSEGVTKIMDVVNVDKAFRYTYDKENKMLTINPKR
jgi:ferric-dicitrate binding protein FerR (iron transport regulator)